MYSVGGGAVFTVHQNRINKIKHNIPSILKYSIHISLACLRFNLKYMVMILICNVWFYMKSFNVKVAIHSSISNTTRVKKIYISFSS